MAAEQQITQIGDIAEIMARDVLAHDPDFDKRRLRDLGSALGSLTPDQLAIFGLWLKARNASEHQAQACAEDMDVIADTALTELWRACSRSRDDSSGGMSFACEDWRVVAAFHACFTDTRNLSCPAVLATETATRNRFKRAYLAARKPEHGRPAHIIKGSPCAWWFVGEPTPEVWEEVRAACALLPTEAIHFLNRPDTMKDRAQALSRDELPSPAQAEPAKGLTIEEVQAMLKKVNSLAGVR